MEQANEVNEPVNVMEVSVVPRPWVHATRGIATCMVIILAFACAIWALEQLFLHAAHKLSANEGAKVQQETADTIARGCGVMQMRMGRKPDTCGKLVSEMFALGQQAEAGKIDDAYTAAPEGTDNAKAKPKRK